MITKETIVEFFLDIEDAGDFDTSGKLLWSYFFLDKNLKKLKGFSNELEKLGFRFKDIFEADKINEDDVEEYYLQVERIEHHTVESLFQLNEFFYKLADENSIEFYDGFDVGNIINSENIRR